MSNFTRNIISRCTIGVVAVALLYGSIACFRAGAAWRAEWIERHPPQPNSRQRDMSGAGYAFLAGAVLVVVGGFIAIIAVVPTDWLLVIFPLRNTTLHDNPSRDNPHGRW